MTRFMDFVNRKYSVQFHSYWDLYDWSVEKMPDFWATLWEFTGMIASKPYEKAVNDLSKFPGTAWFPGVRLNFAENLLRHRDDHLAFVFVGESQKTAKMTYSELYNQVSRLARSLHKVGVKAGDRVSAYMPNIIETVVAMLAATSIGATWASCGAELGPSAVIDRLGQIQPKILFTVDGYFYKGKAVETLPAAQKVAKGVPSIKKVVVASYSGTKRNLTGNDIFVSYDEFIEPEAQLDIEFEQLPFDHPVYIMFSSGTTGKPKCMVQGVGVLLNQLRDVVLHNDLKQEDRITYITTASWMMWNWLVSSLAVGDDNSLRRKSQLS